MSNRKRFRIEITGNVQGVGFRPFVYRVALRENLSGFVCNSLSGVTIEVEGEQDHVQIFIQEIMVKHPVNAVIERFCHKEVPVLKQTELFKIVESQYIGNIQNIPPDLSTCKDCIDEIFNPKDRRYLYPFTNCIHCGPRFTIIKKLPYDRKNTSMCSFVMCSLCHDEYKNPENRRFHAQPIVCSDCGPHLEFIDGDNNILFSHHEAMKAAISKIKQGFIVAVKGLGGFQLIVDAKNEDSVMKLRFKKARKSKPFAVMYPDIEKIKEDCFLTVEEACVLHSPSPIVLLKKRDNHSLAPGVSKQNPYLGVMIPYTPLHHIMMRELQFPVVVTSGNRENEPICICEKDAVKFLSQIADFFLVHNRPIVRHADDSVVKVAPFPPYTPTIWRCARGYAPTKIYFPISKKNTQKILATGAQQKNSVAFFYNNQIMLSQYIGDLSSYHTCHKFEDTIDDFQKILEIIPEIIVTDKHPDYENHKFIEKQRISSISVQHHYAHILSTIAEHNVQQPLIGIAWDGTGFGEDGTVWGGEFLKITETYFERFAYFLPFSLLGGEKAIEEPRRVALALLYEAFGEEIFTWEHFYCVTSFTATERKIFNLMLRKKINCPQTSSVGRIFDGIASLLGICHINTYEGEAAMMLEYNSLHEKRMLCSPKHYSYFYTPDTKIINWIPMIQEIILDLKNKENTGTISRKFHNTLTKIIMDVCNDFCFVHQYKESDLKVVLGGGCFQNHTLLQSIHQHYTSSLYYPQKIPCNDNGIAVGQIVAALRMQFEK